MALTTGLSMQTTFGGRHFEVYHVKGDAATTTFDPGLACVDHSWLQSISGVTCALRTSESAGVITLTQHNGGALEANWYYLFIIGSA